jgi:hypothetical protein
VDIHDGGRRSRRPTADHAIDGDVARAEARGMAFGGAVTAPWAPAPRQVIVACSSARRRRNNAIERDLVLAQCDDHTGSPAPGRARAR